MPWQESLEGQSLEIAISTASTIRVVAGPGTGKTFALLRRLARILEQGQDPRRVLLVTFTRVSAADLERELEGLGLPQAEQVKKGTLHSLCFSILQHRHVFEFTQRVPRPLLKFEERFLLEDLVSYGDFGTIHERRATLKAFEAAWARTQDRSPGWPATPMEQAFQGSLDEWLRFCQAMLVDELVPVTLRYLRSNPECPELQQYDHVLVDEYQDLNRAEQELVDLLAQGKSFVIVGDQDQAIYEDLRFAHPEGIAQFHETHEDTIDIPLDVSRRCPSTIVALANSLIRHNLRRSERQLIPMGREAQVDVQIIQWPDMRAEAEGIAEHIARKVSTGAYRAGQVLVLCPRRPFGYLVRDQLRSRNIDAHSFFHEEALDGNPKRIDESKAQQAFTLLNLLAKPNDRVALRAWLGFGSSQLRAKEYKRLRDHCATSGQSPGEALREVYEERLALPHISGIVARYELLDKTLQELTKLEPKDAFDRLFPASDAWAEPFRMIYEQATEPLDHETALALLRTNITQPELPTNANYIRIMSLHKSKGLTADHVFIPACIEGLIPFSPPNLPFEEERRFHEEQRRLFYVAITRARQTLVISSSRSLPRDLSHRMRAPVVGGDAANGETIDSSFLAELGDACPRPRSGQEWLANS